MKEDELTALIKKSLANESQNWGEKDQTTVLNHIDTTILNVPQDHFAPPPQESKRKRLPSLVIISLLFIVVAIGLLIFAYR